MAAPNRVDATNYGVQASTPDAMLDRLRGVAERVQITTRQHPLLPSRQLPGGGASRLRDLVPHRDPKFGAADSHPSAGLYAGRTTRTATYAAAASAPAASRSASARSVRSQLKSSSARPKWP